MDIPRKKVKKGPSKLVSELALGLYINSNDAILCPDYQTYLPVTTRTLYRYAKELELCGMIPHLVYLQQKGHQQRFCAFDEAYDRYTRKYDRYTDDRYDKNLYTDFPAMSGDAISKDAPDPHLIHLHRLICLLKLFDGNYQAYIGDNIYYTEGILDGSIEEGDPDVVPDPFILPAEKARHELTKALGLPKDAISLRTAQRYLKEIMEAIELYMRMQIDTDSKL